MTKLFYLSSGEHPTLPSSELKAILEAENYKYQVLQKLTQVLRVETDVNSVKPVTFRSAMTKTCATELFNCNAKVADIFQKIHSTPLEQVIEKGESFVVRIKRVRGTASHLDRVELERKLGEQILNKVKGTRVNLKNPQKTFFGVLTDNKLIFGLKIGEVPTKPFSERRPRKRPFFHPTAMKAKLARCMVNLAQPKTGELVLDPFCGTATMLIEASLIGCRVVGFDVKRRMVEGSLRNLLCYNVRLEGLGVADARHPPMVRVDCIVTDPPYGRSATTLGWSTKQIMKVFLSSVENMLPRGKKICTASPKSIRVGNIGREVGFKHVESHLVYVHRSLTREIAVFERT
ncbi:MAG: TRM11 family methyltransferase [Candidatus Bathyarchaeota archaeon]